MTLEEMRELKKKQGLTNEELARLSGVPFSTVQKIFSGKTQSPRMDTVRALEKALTENEKARNTYPVGNTENGMVMETAPAYVAKKQGEYTLEDYYALPDERRVELIDGELFDMAAPSLTHQAILGELHIQFHQCIDSHCQNCRVYLSPCDVQLDNDEKTMVQPDLFVVCHDFDRQGRSFPGAPELTVEIMSDSTRSKDLLLKTYKYLNAGVREYWVIDPKHEEILVYYFSENELTPEKYSFSDSIPIHISEGKCRIDFGKIKERL